MKMSLQVSESEITSAIVDFIKTQGVDVAGKELKVDFINGRGNKGTYADITLSDADNAAPQQVDMYTNPPIEPITEEPAPAVESVETVEDSTEDADNIFGS